MEQMHKFFSGKIKMGRKGQITIPKALREEDHYKEKDVFIIRHTRSGEIILKKQENKTPEDLMLEAIREAPPFDFEDAWKEVLEERKRER